MYNKNIKRLLDLLCSICAFLLFSWLFLLIMLMIKLTSKGPFFFRQKRIGLHKKHFYMIKFRTMRVDTPKDTPTHLLINPEQYITPLGHFLRKTSLDELPQLINIIRGDMALIGPRPALWNQDDLIEERDKYGANDVRPGLTGWAQINGRDELPIPVKAKFDGEYIERMGFFFDLKCLFKTVGCVLKHDGVKEGAAQDKITGDSSAYDFAYDAVAVTIEDTTDHVTDDAADDMKDDTAGNTTDDTKDNIEDNIADNIANDMTDYSMGNTIFDSIDNKRNN